MLRAVALGSAGAIHASWSAPIDKLVHEIVAKPLLGCELKLTDVDTVASDTLDGLLVPVRGDIPGNLGRSYCYIVSSGAAVVMVESRAERILLVDWGETEEVRLVRSACSPG
jgi:hypothetical protein